jgi:signal transduction histidine kinase
MCAEDLAKQVEELQERLESEVSRRKALEASLQESQEKLQEAEARAEATTCLKSSLLTNMSHELRTPLTSIIAHASILERKLDGEIRNSARMIKCGGERLNETLNSVLILAQLEAKTLEPVTSDVDLEAVLAQAIETWRPLAHDKDLWLRTSLEADEVTFRSDPRCLRRILNNLIGNAIKFTEEGGVSVSIHADDELVIEVRDTGQGMGEDFLCDLFEAFTQESSGLTRTHEGTGLGLAITRHLVDTLGGDINVKTQRGVGSVFTVRLPCTPSCASIEDLSTDCQLAPLKSANSSLRRPSPHAFDSERQSESS